MAREYKKPKLRRAWAWAWCIFVTPLVLVYIVFRYAAKLVANLFKLLILLAPRCRSGESLSNPLSNWIETVLDDDL
jgi:hypothetical protein